jgi:hypothetical protein
MQIYVGAVNYVIDYAVDADRILAQPSANISMTAIFTPLSCTRSSRNHGSGIS